MANEDKTQWTNADYSQEEPAEQETYELEDADSDEENAQEGYEEEEYEEDSGEDYAAPAGSRLPVLLLLLVILVLICAGVFFLIKHLSAGKSDTNAGAGSVPVQVQQQQASDDSFFGDSAENAENSDMASVSFEENNGAAEEKAAESKPETQETAQTADEQQKAAEAAEEQKQKEEMLAAANKQAEEERLREEKLKEEKEAAEAAEQDALLETFGDSRTGANSSIMVAWNRAARQNPFRPPLFDRANDGKYEQVGDVQFEIIEPPSKLVPDENLTKLLQTQISGIMYDKNSPSAIVNIAGRDQFVKIGDVVSGYRIKNITNSRVEISYKNNTYVASVGELFTRGRLESKSDVANLKNKFAGRYKNKKIEE